MKKFIKDYFNFNKPERNGIFILLSMILVLLLFNPLISVFFPAEDWDFSDFEKEIAEYEESVRRMDTQRESGRWERSFDSYSPDRSMAMSRLKPFAFDPNLMGEEDWKRLGLTPGQVSMIGKYQSRGGRFRCRADFRKMYCISADEYAVLESFIMLPETLTVKSYPASGGDRKKAEFLKKSIELNSATEEDLKEIRGIGDYFARKIIAYRNRLGGFIRAEQLLEVSKLDSALYDRIRDQVTVNPAAVKRMDVNTVDFETLSKHPYAGYNVALSLINYRTQHGPFRELTDIKKCALITEERFGYLLPYLKLN